MLEVMTLGRGTHLCPACRGDMYASASVGWRWLVGAGMEGPDQGLAFQHFRAGAEQGDATALFNLGAPACCAEKRAPTRSRSS